MKTISDDIANGKIKKVYLLYGAEEYLKLEFRNRLVKALVSPGDDMNFSVYEGKNIDIKAVISQAEIVPFFAERRVILLENTGFFKKSEPSLAEFLAELPEYLCVIFRESEVDKRGKLYKAVVKNGYAAEFDVQNEKTLSEWIALLVKRSKKKISQSTIKQLISRTGTDMNSIKNEVDKLIAYAAYRDEITVKDIDAVCGELVTNRIFELVSAVADRDIQKAMERYYDLLALKEPPMRILFLMARQYEQMHSVKSLASLSEREIASIVGVQAFVVKKLKSYASKYTIDELREILEDFIQVEYAVKTGKLSDNISVELMIMKYGKPITV